MIAVPPVIRRWLKRRVALAGNDRLLLGPGVDVSRSSFGRNVRLDRDVQISNSTIGDHSYAGPDAVIMHAQIGKFCSLAPEVNIGAGSHPTRGYVSTHPIFYMSRPQVGWSFVDRDQLHAFAPTIIGNDVWIGIRAIVRDGITIGDGAIIGAGAVVVKDVEPYAVYGGVPATFLRWRFDEEERAALLQLRWWDRDEAWLRAHVDAFRDVKTLIKTA